MRKGKEGNAYILASKYEYSYQLTDDLIVTDDHSFQLNKAWRTL